MMSSKQLLQVQGRFCALQTTLQPLQASITLALHLHFVPSASCSRLVKGTEYFSVPAFFVCFREAVEACVIIAVLIKFLDKVNKKHLQRDVWLGALSGLAIAIIAGIGLIIAFYAVDKNFFVGRQEMLFEGILSLFASIIITVLAMSMLKISKFQAMWEAKLSANLVKAEAEGSSLRRSTMFWIPFISVLREGLETVIFLAGVGAGYPAKSIPIPGIVGLLTGLAVGYALFRAGSKTSVHTFLLCSTVLLTFIAAGLMGRASHEFQEAGTFGTYENADGEVVGRMNKPAWDICDATDSENNEGWATLKAIFYYTCDPSGIEILFYCGYWVVTSVFIAFKLSRSSSGTVFMLQESDEALLCAVTATTDRAVSAAFLSRAL
eukprot:17231-Heterococcus_DN1.PRE.1